VTPFGRRAAVESRKALSVVSLRKALGRRLSCPGVVRVWCILSLLAAQVWAQKVVVLEFEGDSGKLRSQIEKAVAAGNVVEVVPLTEYKEAAAKKKLKGALAVTPQAVARVSKTVAFDAAVTGQVDGKTLHLFIYDRGGDQLWAKDLALTKGLLAKPLAQKLSRAITAAAENGAQRPPSKGGDADTESGEGAEVPRKATDESQKEKSPAEPSGPALDLSQETPASSRASSSASESVERDSDLEELATKKKRKQFGPPLFRVFVGGSTIARSQCLRPGVNSCSEYDRLKVSRQPVPQGITVDYGGSFGYLGFNAAAEVFPLHAWDNRILQGFGVLGRFQYGSAASLIKETTTQGEGMAKQLVASDISWAAELAWRFHFEMGLGPTKQVGHVGIRGGLAARSFNVDPTVTMLLPSSVRTSPTGAGFLTVGLDGSAPLIEWLRLEGGAHLLVLPQPAPEQIKAYGSLADASGGVRSFGFGFDLGVGGKIYGPLGWALRGQFQYFKDTYQGQGASWTICDGDQCGGVGEEWFINVQWGLTAQF
jgi:hypothetical protein